MNNKKIIMYVSIILILIILASIGYLIINKIKNNKNNKINNLEYIPEEEISDEQFRQTLITLYFLNNKQNNIQSEIRKIDSKILINNPYDILINLLIEGPNDENLLKLIPDNTNLISTELKGNILYINFSKEFINNQNLGKEKEELILKSIVNTVTELNEIDGVVILIEGEENKAFSDNEVLFNKVFVRDKNI